MPADEITIDRNTLRALGADTRIDILKKLTGKRRTQAELAQELKMSAPSIQEHVQRLLQAGLIQRAEPERQSKWKYYELTEKGAALVAPSQKKIWFLLAISLLIFTVSIYSAQNNPLQQFTYGGSLSEQALQPQAEPSTLQQLTAPQAKAAPFSAPLAAGSAQSNAIEEPETDTTATPAAQTLPYAQIIIALASIIAAGACIATITRKKKSF